MRVVNALTAIALLSSPAAAAPAFKVHAVQAGEESAVYEKGRVLVQLVRDTGVIQISPLVLEHGRMVFGVAVYNNGFGPVNFGIENIRILTGNEQPPVLSAEELIRKEKNRARWKQFGIAMLAGLGAAAAANSRDTYRGVYRTPYGTYTSTFSAPSIGGQIAANQIARDGGYALAAIEYQLQQTRAALEDQIVQTTTLQPGDSYSGRFVIDKPKSVKLPQDVRVLISWNGEEYPFTFRMAGAKDVAPPPFTKLTTAKELVLRQPQPSGPTGIAPGAAPAVQRSAVQLAVAQAPVAGEIRLRSGAIKVPADTASGYCLRTPPYYVGTGSADYPAVTGGLPRCSD